MKSILTIAIALLLLLIAVPAAAQTPAFWERAYTYDGSGNVISAGADRYAYDRIGRVTYADAGPGKRSEYTYDRYGNLRTITRDGSAATQISISVDAATNRIVAAGGNVWASYDPAGRMEASLLLGRAEYDALDAAVETRIDGARRIHLYSASDERIATLAVDTQGQEQSSDWTIRDPSGQVLRKLTRNANGSWSWRQDYVYRDGTMLAAEVDGPARTLHYHLDHLGTPRVITGSGGAVVSEHTYHAFGREATDPAQDTEPRKFTGHERDANTLDYMHARYYNPEWGRFLSVDPAQDSDPLDPQSWNLYAYVRNNPVNATDPDGEATVIVGAGIGAAIGGGVELGKQLWRGEKVNWTKVGAASLNGAITGGVAGATLGAPLIVEALALGSANVAGGYVQRGLDNDQKTKANDGKEIAVDFVAGAVGGAVANKAHALTKSGVTNSSAQKLAVREADHVKRANRLRSESHKVRAATQVKKVEARPADLAKKARSAANATGKSATMKVSDELKQKGSGGGGSGGR